jgi:hypothetical protein
MKYPPNYYVKHTLRFASFFTPGAAKALRLYFLSGSGGGNTNFGSVKGSSHNKILIKQSYVFLAWINYISTPEIKSSVGFSTATDEADSGVTNSRGSRSRPALFVHPLRNYKTTIIKAPMAHKTFSQEQFGVRYYSFSVSFLVCFGDVVGLPIVSAQESNYYALLLLNSIPYFSTNMLILQKYSLLFNVCDSNFYHYLLY